MSGTAETRIENAVADLNRQIAQAPLPEAPVRAPMPGPRALFGWRDRQVSVRGVTG